MKCNKGFTLLEFIIAFALLTIILSTTYLAQSNSIFSSTRTKKILIANNLARNFLAESEVKLEGVKFDSLSKEEKGDFPAPNEDFKWKREIQDIDFGALSDLMMSQMKDKNQMGVSEQETMVSKMFQDYLKKSVRKMVITIEWPEGDGTQKLSFTSLLVNYDAEFANGQI